MPHDCRKAAPRSAPFTNRELPVSSNPWDIGSAPTCRRDGFPALAATSAGFGIRRQKDGVFAARSCSAHFGEIVAATKNLPVTADFEGGFAKRLRTASPGKLPLCVATGVAGLSIEKPDRRDKDKPLHDLPISGVARWGGARGGNRARREPTCASDAENLLVGRPDLEESDPAPDRLSPGPAPIPSNAPSSRTPEQIAAGEGGGTRPGELPDAGRTGWLRCATLPRSACAAVSVGGTLARVRLGRAFVRGGQSRSRAKAASPLSTTPCRHAKIESLPARRHEDAPAMIRIRSRHPVTGQPVGATEFNEAPAQPPGPVTLEGCYRRCRTAWQPGHAGPRGGLGLCGHGSRLKLHVNLWTVFRCRGVLCHGSRQPPSTLDDPYSYAIVDHYRRALAGR